jgi:outer membrane protein OmpA-like peptidoglycan-associated protein
MVKEFRKNSIKKRIFPNFCNFKKQIYYIIYMLRILFSKEIKSLALSVAMFAVFAVAGEGNINYYGQLGVHKTQSAQTLGHGRLGLGFFLEGAGLGSIIKDYKFEAMNPSSDDEHYNLANYLGLNLYPFLSLGLSEYFDISVGFPAYGEYLKADTADARSDLRKDFSAGGQGNLFISIKIRAPFDGSFPLDFAIIPGFGVNTGRENSGKQNDYGPWIRDPMFLNKTETYLVGYGAPSSYTNASNFFKFGVAGTMDFNRIKAKIPLLLHLNYSYRTPLGKEGVENYPKVQSFASALEWTPVQFASFFGEYYTDMPTEWPKLNNKDNSTDLNTVSLGGSFHLSKNVDMHLGAQIFMGDKEKYVDQLAINVGDSAGISKKATYSARLIPDYVAFGGFTIKLFTVEPVVEEEEEEEEEYRNPDTDEDGVCDPWVAESGRQREFKKICSGIDLCPYEAGTLENKGCPEKKAEAAPAPTVWFSASPDVINKGQSATLTWQVSNASSVEIEGIGTVEPSGSKKVKPTESTTYTLTATGDGGTRVSTVEIEIAAGPVPVILFSINPESIQTGQPATLKWEVTNATEVNIDGGIGKVQTKGSKQVKPTSSIAYTLTATGEGGTRTETVEIEVAEPPPIEARVNLQGVTFGSGNATLTPNAKKVLDGVAEQLLANPKVKIEIQGHTDNQGKPAANQDLSERRAKSVVGYLANKGVSTSRMKAVGYGPDVPIADNRTPEGRELNRRIEMVRVDN